MTAALVDALSELAGVTITVRHPLNDGAARLMGTLGVNVVVDPAAAPCSRIVVMRHGQPDHYSSRMCPECARIEAAA